MKGFSREFILILGIALCAEWTSIVNGEAVSGGGTMGTQHEVQRCNVQTNATKLLLSVLHGLTAEKPFIMFADNIDEINDKIEGQRICEKTSLNATTMFYCKLWDSNTITLQTVAEKPSYVYLSVNQGEMPATDNALCDIGTFLVTWLHQTFSLPKRTSLSSSECSRMCNTKHRCLLCPISKTICTFFTTDAPVTTTVATTTNLAASCDMSGQNTPPSNGDGVMPIIIASVVSFIAGIGVCLLVLCLIGHFHGRLCLKFTNTSKYVEKTEKQTQMNMKTTSGIDVTEHEYLNLRVDTMPDPNTKSQCPSEVTPSAGQKQSNMTTHHPVYETMTNEKKDHVYSGYKSSESNPPKLYEHTTPSRSSEHVYSGLANDTDSSDQMTRHQPPPVSTSGGNSYANIQIEQHDATNGNPMPESCDNQVEANDYFVLEKEQHCTDHPKPEPGPDLDDTETIADNDDYHAYHILHKL